jgi:hypothetical protein
METNLKMLGLEYLNTLTSIINLTHIWKSQDRDKQTINLMKQAEKLQRDILDSNHPLTVGSTQILHE